MQTQDKITKFDDFYEKIFESFKLNLQEELNIYESEDEDIKQILISIINEYEMEFYNNYTEIFIYNYYKNLLNGYNSTMNKILNFAYTKRILDDQGKDEVVKSERADCQNVLYLYNLRYEKQDSEQSGKLVSNITGRNIPIAYQAEEIITNQDIFFRPPKGNPQLRGPHINYTIEYDVNYWAEFKNQIAKYIQDFEETHTEDFLDDLQDYRYWLNKYRNYLHLLNQKEIIRELKGGNGHVKN